MKTHRNKEDNKQKRIYLGFIGEVSEKNFTRKLLKKSI